MSNNTLCSPHKPMLSRLSDKLMSDKWMKMGINLCVMHRTDGREVHPGCKESTGTCNMASVYSRAEDMIRKV